ncbi:MAG: toll/interleukin-1 receptor domain-containing protein [Rubrivivax sp.]|nr:toll/interleukin-1 receptor domain-containing protein [Rubrivivax sp.]
MPQRACRVFISHSAHATEEPGTQGFLDALIAAIAAEPDFEPLADQTDLAAGDAWMQQLYAWMGLCDAAVIVLSPRAVRRENSAWVPRETNLLLWRKALDPGFVVIPVWVGGLEAADLQANPFLADARLDELQLARAVAGQPDADKIEPIVRALRDKLAARRAQLVFDPLRVHLEDCLQRFAPPASIEQALLRHFAQETWQPLVPPAQKLALHMLRSAAAGRVDSTIDTVALGSQEKFQLGSLLFECLFPLRLPAEPACRLHQLCHEQTGRGSVVVNAVDVWVLEVLLRSATGLPRNDLLRTWRIIELTDDWGDDDLAEATRRLAVELAESMLGTGAWDLLSDQAEPEARFKEQLVVLNRQLAEAREDTQAPVIVCVAYRPRWLELASELARRFPTTVFVLRTSEALQAALPDAADCVALSPTWPPGRDRDWRLSYRGKLVRFGGTPT